jgi:hypothetical protein
MFEDYTINQLLALRSLCADIIERADGVQQRADTLLVFECGRGTDHARTEEISMTRFPGQGFLPPST